MINKESEERVNVGSVRNASDVNPFLTFFHPLPPSPPPPAFPYPFHYTPDPLARAAAAELQAYLRTQADWQHDFGEPDDHSGARCGKMFGVLVVRTRAGELGYLAAFSGKIADSNHHSGFVPPVFDILDENGFFRQGEAELNALNRRIEALEAGPDLAANMEKVASETAAATAALEAEKQRQKATKADRQERREAAANWPEAEKTALEATLIEESKRDHFILKDLKKHWQQRLEVAQHDLDAVLADLKALKEERRAKSAALQQRIFDEYAFLNKNGAAKSLADIFQRFLGVPPPAGAGECAAPKLLQYAFLHDLEPVTMAEFWWGASPVGEIRKHGQFYPACRGKCEPILSHMLEGMTVDENPLRRPGSTADIPVVYEDDYLIVVDKPHDLLSVPGKTETDSVYFRLKQRYPDLPGLMIVHRLDMATSGLLVLAKTEEVYKILQGQFMSRAVKKRYVALLEGNLPADSGVIDLPLRVDLDDRPRQMVCYEHGKAARTEWEVVSRENGCTRVHFYPVTGRTHQLRVHAAHPLGLNTPIVGDDLYGNKAERLYLHAARLEFLHPVKGEWVVLASEAKF